MFRKWNRETIEHIVQLANSRDASKAGTFVLSGHSIFMEKPEVVQSPMAIPNETLLIILDNSICFNVWYYPIDIYQK